MAKTACTVLYYLNMTPPDELAMLAIAGTVKEQLVIIAICKHGQTQETTVAFLVCVIVTNGNLIHLCTVALLVQSLGTHNDSYSRLDWTTSRFIAIVVLLQLSIQSRLVCPQQARYKEMGVLVVVCTHCKQGARLENQKSVPDLWGLTASSKKLGTACRIPEQVERVPAAILQFHESLYLCVTHLPASGSCFRQVAHAATRRCCS